MGDGLVNIQELYETVTKHHAEHVANVMDGASFAYVTEQLKHLRSVGLDPTEYEVIMVRNEFPQQTDDGYKIDWRIRLVRREELEDVPHDKS